MSRVEGPCNHDVVYAGVVNLVRGFGIRGAVDVWTCNRCHDIWCDEKRMEHQELPPEVGLPPRRPGTQWAILVCEHEGSLDWNTVQLRSGDIVNHSCSVFQNCSVKVGEGWSLSCGTAHGGSHRLILVEPSLNTTVEL
ncbi:MAG TPA: hypothetical protein VMS77_09170 [Conexivisphaerales archaeon]|nr:hypothetical protein [Conexivisphaerales archaeon]